MADRESPKAVSSRTRLRGHWGRNSLLALASSLRLQTSTEIPNQYRSSVRLSGQALRQNTTTLRTFLTTPQDRTRRPLPLSLDRCRVDLEASGKPDRKSVV